MTQASRIFQELGIETVVLDLVNDSIEDISEAMIATEQAEIKRFIMVSTFRTGREEIAKDNDLKVYTIPKHYDDEWLKHRTELDWTIVHPGNLTNSAGSGKIKVGMSQEIEEIPRQDVAQTLLEALRNDNTIKKEFEVLAGERTIDEAIASLY